MADLGEKVELSAYNFAGNSGYGTAKHRAALSEFGASEVHRRSFKPIAEILAVSGDNFENVQQKQPKANWRFLS